MSDLNKVKTIMTNKENTYSKSLLTLAGLLFVANSMSQTVDIALMATQTPPPLATSNSPT